MTPSDTQSKPKTRTYRRTRVKKNSGDPSFVEQARRKQILDVALGLFEKKGFRNTSLADIAEVLNVSKGVISYNFDGKVDLGEQVLLHSMANYGRFIQKGLSEFETAYEKLIGFTAVCLDYVSAHEPGFQVYIDTLGAFETPEARRRFVAEQDDGLRQLLIDLVNDAIAEGSIPDQRAQPIADLMQSVVDGLMQMYSANPKSVDLDACGKAFESMLRYQIEA